MQIVSLTNYCYNYLMENINKDNCLRVWETAFLHDIQDLATKALSLVTKHFVEVQQFNDFKLLCDVDFMLKIIKSETINCPNKSVLLTAVLKWVEADIESRLCYLRDLVMTIQANTGLQFTEISNVVSSIDEINQTEEWKDIVTDLARQNILVQRNVQSSPHFDECLVILTNRMNSKKQELCCFSKQQHEWYKLADLTTDLGGYFATCSYGTDLLVSGGTANPRAFYSYNGQQDTWEKFLDLPEARPRIQHNMVVVRDTVYFIGGVSQLNVPSPIKLIDAFSLKTKSWRNFGDFGRGKEYLLITPVYSCQSVSLDRTIYTFGGVDAHMGKNLTVQYFNTEGEYSGEGAKIPDGALPVVHDSSIYVVCKDGTIYKYVPGQGTEHVIQYGGKGKYFPVSGFGLGVLGNDILVLGGERKFKTENTMMIIGVQSSNICYMNENMPYALANFMANNLHIPRSQLTSVKCFN